MFGIFAWIRVAVAAAVRDGIRDALETPALDTATTAPGPPSLPPPAETVPQIAAAGPERGNEVNGNGRRRLANSRA